MDDRQELDILVVTTTVGSRTDAQSLAAAVIAERLAACVQLDDTVLSVYRWQGSVQEEAEVRLTLKTTVGAEAALRAFLASRHPYELPQMTSWRADASPAYAQWVRGEVVVRPAG